MRGMSGAGRVQRTRGSHDALGGANSGKARLGIHERLATGSDGVDEVLQLQLQRLAGIDLQRLSVLKRLVFVDQGQRMEPAKIKIVFFLICTA